MKSTCTKVRYKDHEQAVGAIKRIKNMPNDGDKPIRAYQCDICHGWHITKRELVTSESKPTWLSRFADWRKLCPK